MSGLALIIAILFSVMSVAHAYSGDMTYNPFNGGLGACGKPINNGDSTVAVASKFFTASNPNNDPICGKSVTIHHNGKTATAQVWDRCTGCGANDLDATPTLFTNLVGSTDPGRVSITWDGI